MCTVTLVPLGKSDFILTTNRDESPNRVTLEPNFYLEDGVKLLYPKDKMAGGTWVGVSDKNRLVCLLNGGFTAHSRQDAYRLSRGVVVKDLLTSTDVLKLVNEYDLNGIEPFTVVLVDWNSDMKFFELVWDGFAKHFKNLPLESNIWSSSSLYTERMKLERKIWFQEFQQANELNVGSVLEFHETAGSSNKEFGVIMDRGFVKTTCITQIVKQNKEIEMLFVNLQSNSKIKARFHSAEIIEYQTKA